MKDSVTGESIVVNTDGDAGPYIIVHQDKVDDWRAGRKRMRKAGVLPGVAVAGTAPSGKI